MVTCYTTTDTFCINLSFFATVVSILRLTNQWNKWKPLVMSKQKVSHQKYFNASFRYLPYHKHGGGKGMSINLQTSKRKFFNMAAWFSFEPLIVIVGINVGFTMCVSSPCFFTKAVPWSPVTQLLILSVSTFHSVPHWNKKKLIRYYWQTMW